MNVNSDMTEVVSNNNETETGKSAELLTDIRNVADEAEGEEHSTVQFSISSYGADYTVDSLVKRLNSEAFFVPDFQRLYVWNVKQASRFIESLLMGLPVPGIFVFRQTDSSRHLIIDGQQRLKTLEFFYAGTFNNKPFVLQDVREPWLNKSYKELTDDDRQKLDDSVIHTTVFRQEQPIKNDKSIYEVFERINTGGSKLSDQEIRVCVNFGGFSKFIRELNTNADWRSIYGPKSVRLKDEELVLRFLTFKERSIAYTRPLRDFLNNFMEDNAGIDEATASRFSYMFSVTVKTIWNAIGKPAFRPERTLNTAVFDSVMVGVSRRLEYGPIKDLPGLKIAYEKLLLDTNFQEAYIRSTADEEKVRNRIELATAAFSKLK